MTSKDVALKLIGIVELLCHVTVLFHIMTQLCQLPRCVIQLLLLILQWCNAIGHEVDVMGLGITVEGDDRKTAEGASEVTAAALTVVISVIVTITIKYVRVKTKATIITEIVVIVITAVLHGLSIGIVTRVVFVLRTALFVMIALLLLLLLSLSLQ